MVGRHRFAAKVRRHALDLFGVLAGIAYGLPSIAYPFGVDQSIHWYIGRRLLDGEMPYVSGISTKPPGVFVVHALSLTLFGDQQWAIRVFDLGFVLATGALIATLRPRRAFPDGHVGPLQPRRPGEIGAACLAVAGMHYTFFDFSDAGHPELWQGFFMLAPVWVVARAPDFRVEPKAAFVAGALACVAVMFKHVAAITGVMVGVAVVLSGLHRRSLRAAGAGAGSYTAGVVVVLALTMLPFWLTGTFGAFWEVMVEFILDYASKASAGEVGYPRWLRWDRGLAAVLAGLGSLLGGIWISAVGRDRRHYVVGVGLMLTTLGAFGTVLLQRRVLFDPGFTYHFVVVVPFLALGAMWGLRRRFPRRGGAQLLTVAAILGLVLLAGPRSTAHADRDYLDEHALFWGWLRGARSQEELDDSRYAGREAQGAMRRVASRVRSLARPGDTLCVDGFLAILYQMTDLRCPSRFFVSDTVYDNPDWQSEHRRVLERSPPTFFVTFPTRPRVRELIRRGYTRHDVTFGPHRYVVLSRRSTP